MSPSLPFSAAALLTDPAWMSWQWEAQRRLNVESLMGCDVEDGFSLESAFEAFARGISPEHYAMGFRAVQPEAKRPI